MTAHHPSSEDKTPSEPPPVGPAVPLTVSARPSAMSSGSPAENHLSPDLAPHKTGNHLSLSSPQLLAELLQSQARRSPRGPSPERSSPLASPLTSPISPPASPITPPVTPPQPLSPTQESLALSSPELLSELKQFRSLRHVNPQRGLTTVFSGRGRATRGSAQVSHSQPRPSPDALTDARRENAGSQLVANGTQR
ncbi:proline-rich receptor-like protein kinase PERK2 [Anguilla anguilla]|uniref:proline-rich receptor-like protein kinase PERK2 n=1 Tax=Anguilla anguilla TaxID=7936 RepID=UPI0015AF1E3B|nr:proline-rich receptor-like protein kinase PERK2 [Anguilla anguilla]